MIRKLTPSLFVLATLMSTMVGAEPQSLLPTQPQLPSSPRLLQVSQTTTVPTPAPSPGISQVPQPTLMPTPESSHERMLSSESCGANYANCQPQPAPVATWWSNSLAGRAVHQVAEDTCKANRWPEPFIQYDRESTRVAFATMVEKGWKRQNTLGDVHFDLSTSELNMSGRVKVRRIVLEGLPSRRDLFIYRANTMSDTEQRLHSVEQYVHQLVGDVPDAPQVVVTNLPPVGWPAQYVDAITRKYIETMPDPRIPEDTEANFTEE